MLEPTFIFSYWDENINFEGNEGGGVYGGLALIKFQSHYDIE